jgi:SAM-dependent methyltransferase
MENRDSFGLDAAGYRQFRPRYPASMFRYLAKLSPSREAALDCATGNGQAAIELAKLFARVAAFDSSQAQIDKAAADDRIEYRVARAETLPFTGWRFDLVTVAQAAHWFDLAEFYRKLSAVLVPGAVIAIWGYSYSRVDPAVDALVEAELLTRIAPYWADGNKVIVEHYRSIDFPFEPLDWPRFVACHQWSRMDYMQYMRTWSAVRSFVADNWLDPVAELEASLRSVWSDRTARTVEFDLVGRLGRFDGRSLG